ncbi:NAD(P)-dependent oxidoreductase [Chitinophaga nivalis]|uniref:NAD(P)-binding domain-containing protein n=1 Tax=Chitinophaga nivalis TaxID=2991709 RepID=A0ABT3IKM4_9BACT|nr:NAD(P)-binding domain-containing protein [Chitinophaga nivalis]MCW3465793.1 NAD(P)-binding domain-containing protein [Chitinophaga nivalis]MCW3484516.1 NAD(P)-binding domain-containing protein [Chitinophaga nivalis]
MTTTPTTKVAVIGLGAMGTTIADIMLRNRLSVTVWNRTAARTEAAVKAGAIAAPSAAAAISEADIIIMCVFDYKAVQEILQTPAVAAAIRGKLLIQLTTGSPKDAQESETWAHQQGATYLDGAIQVAPEQMAQPDTTILVSGQEAAFQQGEPFLKMLGGNITYLGAQINAAATMDLATLSYVYGAALGFFHGALIAESNGFNVGMYGDIVANIAPGMGAFLQHEGKVIQSGNFAISQSPLSISAEATARMEQTAREAGISTSFPAYASGLFKKAMAAGYGNEELAAMIKVLREA